MNDCNHAQCKQVHQLLDGMLEMLNLPAMEGIVSVGKAVVVCEEIKRLSADYQGMKKKLADLSDMMAMRLSAISAASYQNTDATRKERIDRRNDYWTPAYGDVCAAVDREIALKRNAAWTCRQHAYPYGFSEDGPHDPICPWCERLEVERFAEELSKEQGFNASRQNEIDRLTAELALLRTPPRCPKCLSYIVGVGTIGSQIMEFVPYCFSCKFTPIEHNKTPDAALNAWRPAPPSNPPPIFSEDGAHFVSQQQTKKDGSMPEKQVTFGEAIEALKQGKRVARTGWNGKGMYLWLLPAAQVKAEWCKEPHLKSLAEANGGTVDALGSIRMLTADKKVLTGWLASQTDMLSEDWVILD